MNRPPNGGPPPQGFKRRIPGDDPHFGRGGRGPPFNDRGRGFRGGAGRFFGGRGAGPRGGGGPDPSMPGGRGGRVGGRFFNDRGGRGGGGRGRGNNNFAPHRGPSPGSFGGRGGRFPPDGRGGGGRFPPDGRGGVSGRFPPHHGGPMPPPPPPPPPGRARGPPPPPPPVMRGMPPQQGMHHQHQMAPPLFQQQQQGQGQPPPIQHHQPQQTAMQPHHRQSYQQGQQFPSQQQQRVSTALANTPSAATLSYTKEQVDEAWTEHLAPDAVTKYYYNAITKDSTYTMPEPLARKQQPSSATTATTTAQPAPWIEYTDATTGKKYYSNGTTTTWEKPSDFDSGSSHKRTSVDDSTPQEESTPKRRKKATTIKLEFNNKAEVVAAFKGLLLAKNVLPTTKWNDVVKLCSGDARWEACAESLTLGERKQALAEYQTKRANELKTLERQERIRAKEAFVNLLTEKVPSILGFNPQTSQLSDMRDALSKDDRFYTVNDESTRETLFLEFCEEVRKREERKKRKKKRETKDAFLAFLNEHEESGELTFASTWGSFMSTLKEEDTKDARFQVSSEMSESERELHFSDYVIQLQADEDEKRRRIRDARRRAEKAQRDAYRETLQTMSSKGHITPSTRWRDVESLLSSEASFAPVQEQDREAPRELFGVFVEEWSDIFRRDRPFLSRLVHPPSRKGIVVKADTTYEEFKKALLDAAADSPEIYSETRLILTTDDPVSSALVYFNELVARAGETAEARSKRRSTRRGSSAQDESSEDEGEIIEDGEIEDDEEDQQATSKSVADKEAEEANDA